jgi:alpha-mannosidase
MNYQSFTMRQYYLILIVFFSLAVAGQINGAEELKDSFPAHVNCTVQSYYKLRSDGKPGREVTLDFNGQKISGKITIEITAGGKKEKSDLSLSNSGQTHCEILLPDQVGVKKESRATIVIRQGEKVLKCAVEIPPMRQWSVYIYPHSHVDIGYTNTQANVEILHKRNIDEGIKLGEATTNYPDGSKYRWNPEITWPLERYWQSASSEQKERVVKAIQDGSLCIDASYLNLNTSSCSDEELFQVLRFSREMEKLTGVPMRTYQQMDIPGMSWGLVPVMAQQGGRYVMAWPNGCRAGNAHVLDEKPFWWIGPDGKSKVLYFQPGSYSNSGSMTKGGATGRPWFGQRDTDKIPAVIKTDSANVNFLTALSKRERADNPFNYYVVSWCLWDNCPLDADVPDAVKKWNETYAYPHLIIAGGTEIMQMIEKSYGDKLPEVKGDFTEYWTDGLGTAAALTAMNRNTKEQLVQAETLWTMLGHGKKAPRAEFDEAWRYIALGSEHTYTTENPTEPFFQDAIWKVKQHYFHEAQDRTQSLLESALAPATDRSSGALGPIEGPSGGGISVINTQSWPHSGLVTLTQAESQRGDRINDSEGKEVLSQRLTTGELVFLASDIPALGSAHYQVMAGSSPLNKGCSLVGTTMANELLEVTIDPVSGNISHLLNKETGKNFVATNGLNTFHWMPGDRDNPQADSAIVISTVESGPLVVELKATSKAIGCRSVSRSVRLIYGLPSVEISDVIDKLPLPAKDGVHIGFGFDIPKAITRIDIPWGIVEVEKDQQPAGNRNWLTMQRWADVSNEKEGVTWCSLDAPLIESGSMTANQTGTWSGERKPWLKKLESAAAIYSWVMNNHWFTNFPLTQDGPVTFRYRILPHGVYNVADANRFGLEQVQPLIAFAAKNNAVSKPLFAVEGSPAVTVSILKSPSSKNSMIIRLRSVSAKDEMVRLSWPAGTPSAVNLCETEEVAGPKINNELSVPANGMATLKVVW